MPPLLGVFWKMHSPERVFCQPSVVGLTASLSPSIAEVTLGRIQSFSLLVLSGRVVGWGRGVHMGVSAGQPLGLSKANPSLLREPWCCRMGAGASPLSR